MNNSNNKNNNKQQSRTKQSHNEGKKNFTFILLLILAGLLIATYFVKDHTTAKHSMDYSKFLTLLDDKNIVWDKIQIVEQNITGWFKPNMDVLSPEKQSLYTSKLKQYLEQDYSRLQMGNNDAPQTYRMDTYSPTLVHPDFIQMLRAKQISFTSHPREVNIWMEILISILPWLIIFGLFWFFMFRQIQNSGNKALSFGRSRAKPFIATKNKITFKDVASIDEVKQELSDIIDFLKNPQKYHKMGVRIPRGILLIGPPGTGKTLLAKAVAGEANRPFFNISGSEFVEMFVGIGASRVRDLFEQGKRHSPCILFIDELDAVGRIRGSGYGGGHDEREQTLNQMLVEMDGFETDNTVIVIAATNRPDVLDPALLRPGRFDRRITVSIPDIKGRLEILKLHTTNLPLENNIDLNSIAQGTPGFSGADLFNLSNEAGIHATLQGQTNIKVENFEYAKDKILMGPERKHIFISNTEKINTAYHESGHALLSYLLPSINKLHKVSIIPRGNALGVTQTLPQEERLTLSKQSLLDQIVILFGGRVGEEYKYGKDFITNGAYDDIKKATKIAQSMVRDWGMSEAMGPILFSETNSGNFGQSSEPIYGEDTRKRLDFEIQNILKSCHEKAKTMIFNNKDKLEALAQELLTKESLSYQEICKLLESKHNESNKINDRLNNL